MKSKQEEIAKKILYQIKQYQINFTEMSFDTASKILNSNLELNNYIKLLLGAYPKEITRKKIESFNYGEIFKLFLETYCINNNITIIESEDIDMQNLDSTDLSALKLYFDDISSIKPLSEEERFILLKEGKSGNEKAKKQFIEQNLKLVLAIVKKYVNFGIPFLDLIQEGNIGLIKAFDNFDISKGYKFSSFAFSYINSYILASLNQNLIKIPHYLYWSINRYKKLKNMNFSDEEICKKLNITSTQLESIANIYFKTNGLVSLDGDNSPNETEKDFKLIDFIKSDTNVEEEAISHIVKEEIAELLENVSLKEKDKEILILRFGLNGTYPMSYDEIAKVYGITRQAVLQICNKSLRIIRNYISLDNPKIFYK